MSKKIFINASELAIITGHNRFNYLSDYVIKLYERYFHDDYKRIVSLISKKKVKITKSESAQECIKRVVKTNNLDIKKSLNECLKSNNVQELSKKQELLKNTIQKDKNISIQDKLLINESIKSLTNTNFGTNNENHVIKYYESIINKNIITTNDFFSKELFKNDNYTWYVGGKVDGIFINDDNEKVLLEVKNRVKKLFYTLRAYEKVQIYAYMLLLGTNKAKLIECLKNNRSEFNTIDVNFEQDFFEKKILKYLESFIDLFELIMESDKLKIKLLTSEKSDIEDWLKKAIY